MLRKYQQEAVDTLWEYWGKGKTKPCILQLSTGCHTADHPILMSDGIISTADNIQIGDFVMSKNGPVEVIDLHQGTEMMYKVTPVKGSSFVVNGGHILHILQYRRNGNKWDRVESDVSVNEYLDFTATEKHCSKLIYRGYDYGSITPPIPAYLVGAYLGDGATFNKNQRATMITNIDKPVIDKVRMLVEGLGWNLHQSSDSKDWFIRTPVKPPKNSPFKMAMFEIGAMESEGMGKHFPTYALSWDKESRAELLAGLLDTDGSCSRRKGIDFIQKNKEIALGVMRLSRSLGIMATIKKSEKKCQTFDKPRIYYRVHISGHGLESIPMVKHKIDSNYQKKDQMVTGFTVEPVGVRDYYGFEVDSDDHLYLDGYLMEHHNSGKSHIISEIVKRLNMPVLVLQPSKEILEQNYEKLVLAGVPKDKLNICSASAGGWEIGYITLATIGTIYKYPNLCKDFGAIVVDECDVVNSDNANGQYLKFFNSLPLSIPIVGLTACVDGDTEVLTPNGWVRFRDSKGNDGVFAQWKHTKGEEGEIVFDKASIFRGWSDTINKTGWEKEGTELFFTNGHTFPTFVDWHRFVDRKSGSAKFTDRERWFVSGKGVGDGSDLSPYERLCIALQADGHYDNRYYPTVQKGKHKGKYRFAVEVVKTRKQERLKLLLEQSGVDNTVSPSNRFYNKSQVYSLSGQVYINHNAKDLWTVFDLTAISYDKARAIIEEMYQWDGTKDHHSGAKIFSTTNLSQAEFYQAVGCLGGYMTRITSYKPKNERRSVSYRVYFIDRFTRATAALTPEKEIEWHKPVYCLHTKTGYFVARKNGRVFITGNTPWRNQSFRDRNGQPAVYCRPLTRICTTKGDGTPHGKWFWTGGIIYKCEIPFLQQNGYLSPTEYYQAETDWSFVNEYPSRVDYDTQKMTQWMDFDSNMSRFHQAVKWCMDNNLKTIVFTPNIDMNFRLAGCISSAGGSVQCMDSLNDSRDSRQRKMDNFRAGNFQFLVNVGMVGRGVDVPSVDCVLLCRPTKSLSLYMQCLSMDTEVLTGKGWKKYGEVSKGDVLPTLNIETGKGEWDIVKEVMHRPLAQDEKWVVFESPYASIKVTDGHRMIRKRRAVNNGHHGWMDDWEIVPAREFVKYKTGQMVPTSVKIEQPGVPLSDDDLWLIGMLMADGSWKNGSHGELVGNMYISQTDRHPHILAEIEERLNRVGLKYTKKQTRKAGDVVKVSQYVSMKGSKDIVARYNGYEFALYRDAKYRYQSYLSKELSPLLMSINRHQFEVLLEGIWAGDGAKKIGVDYQARTKEIVTAREVVAQRLQMLAAINGYHCFIRKENSARRKNPIWVLSFKDQDWKVIGSAGKRSSRPRVHFEDAYDGDECWCLETIKNKTLITRHNGKVTVMGNCVGRCLRLDPDNPDKVARIVDLSGNVARFGKVEDVALGKQSRPGAYGNFETDIITVGIGGKRYKWEKVG